MVVRSKVLLYPTLLPTTAAAVATVPAGKTWVVRNVRVTVSGSSNRDWDLLLNGSASGDLLRRVVAHPFGTTMSFDSWMALGELDELWAKASQNSTVTLCIFGAELDGVAP